MDGNFDYLKQAVKLGYVWKHSLCYQSIFELPGKHSLCPTGAQARETLLSSNLLSSKQLLFPQQSLAKIFANPYYGNVFHAMNLPNLMYG